MINKKSLINRIWVGALIFIVMAGMIALNIYFPNYVNDDSSDSFVSGRALNSALVSVLIFLSVLEMRRAFGKERIPDCFSWLLWLYGIGLAVMYSLFGYTGIIFFTMVVFIAAVVTSLIKNRVDSLIYIAFILVYPGLFMATLLYLNRSASTRQIVSPELFPFLESDIWSFLGDGRSTNLLPLNAISFAFVFIVSACTDVFAFFVGSLFGKHKLCPKISPKKTVEGAIGGIFGGIVGSAIVFFLFDFAPESVFGAQFGLTFSGYGLSTLQIVLTYVIIALGGSVSTQIGDLIASQVKRYCEIKDYSRILGEHGGIMDRFDGIMITSVLVSFVFMFIY
ncbi:MAG: phosphatidate cytidylyltransferase [Corallococcus sp.]|nr:phosphatidate cytidylyltransferase [Bacillota bacterium]MCM1534130.1 phosphatidate cytidylyltransferase [Corallococcus sp.]